MRSGSRTPAPGQLRVYSAVLQPGDKVLGMNLSHGGHLPTAIRHFSASFTSSASNGVREDNGLIDYGPAARRRRSGKSPR